MAKHPKKIGKNAPCPCGSGKVYKRCCLSRDEREESAASALSTSGRNESDPKIEARVRLLQDLQETFTLPERLGWREFDFGADLYDPVVDDLLEFVGKGGAALDAERATRLTLRMAMGLERHATPEVRARAAGVLEDYLAKRPSSRVRELIRSAVTGLEDLEIRPALMGCLHSLYHDYVLRKADERLTLEREEIRALEAQAEECERRLAQGSSPGFREWFEGLGDAALLWAQRFWEDPKWREFLPDLLELVTKHPSMRSAALLTRVALSSESAVFESQILEGLRRMPEQAWPILLYRARDHEAPPVVRLRAYSFLTAGNQWEILDDLLGELDGTGRWKERMPTSEFPKVAAAVARLGDRRAVGQIVRLLSEGLLPEAAKGAIADAFQACGWWSEIEEALAAERKGVLTLVPAGIDLLDVIRDRLDKEPPDSREALQFRTNILNEEWNRAFHEDLEGLRPCDLAAGGPAEAALLREFAEVAKTQTAEFAEDGIRKEDLKAMVSGLQYHWMRTPNPACGGKIPLAAIWDERRELTPHRAYYNHQREELLNDMYRWARGWFDDGNFASARRELEAVLAIEPEYPFAKRLLDRCPKS